MKRLFIILIPILAFAHLVAQSNKPCLPCLPQGILFSTQAQIDNFQTNYPGCSQVDGDVVISGNEITNLDGLNVLTAISGSFNIYDGTSLGSLSGLHNLTSVGFSFGINDCDILTSLTGLDNVTSIGGSLSINNCTALTNLTGLGNLTSIGGWMALRYNMALTSVTGVENLTSIGGDLIISGNFTLTSLMGLDNLISIGGSLFIYSNHELTSLGGLNNIHSGSIRNLEIVGNTGLSVCTVKSICDYLADPDGTTDIHGNAKGCSSIPEVMDSCGISSVDQLTYEPSLIIYPDPSSTFVNIESPFIGTLSILNIPGQVLLQQSIGNHISTVDVSGLKNGVYFVRLTSYRSVRVGKFVKQ